MSPLEVKKYVDLAVQVLGLVKLFARNKDVNVAVDWTLDNVLNQTWFLDLVVTIVNAFSKGETLKVTGFTKE